MVTEGRSGRPGHGVETGAVGCGAIHVAEVACPVLASPTDTDMGETWSSRRRGASSTELVVGHGDFQEWPRGGPEGPRMGWDRDGSVHKAADAGTIDRGTTEAMDKRWKDP